MDYENETVGILVMARTNVAPLLLLEVAMQATFFQKVIICMFLAFIASCFLYWVRLFIVGAYEELNKGYQHHAIIEPMAKP